MLGKVNSLEQRAFNLSTSVGSGVDIEAIRDRTLAKLKVGRQSTVGKALDAFIREMK
jgi:hypothetical protein